MGSNPSPGPDSSTSLRLSSLHSVAQSLSEREGPHPRISSPSPEAGEQSSRVLRGENISSHALLDVLASELRKGMQRGGLAGPQGSTRTLMA